MNNTPFNLLIRVRVSLWSKSARIGITRAPPASSHCGVENVGVVLSVFEAGERSIGGSGIP